MASSHTGEECHGIWVSPIDRARALLEDTRIVQWSCKPELHAKFKAYLGLSNMKPGCTQTLTADIHVSWVCANGKLVPDKPLELKDCELGILAVAYRCYIELPFKASSLLRKPNLPAGVALLGKTLADDAFVCVSIKVPAKPAEGRPRLFLEIDGEMCQQCGMHSRVEDNVICDVCNTASHLSCVGLSAVPSKDWTCKACKAAAKAPPPKAAPTATTNAKAPAAKPKSTKEQDAPAAAAVPAPPAPTPAAAAAMAPQQPIKQERKGTTQQPKQAASPAAAREGSGDMPAAALKAAAAGPAGQVAAPVDQRPKRNRPEVGSIQQDVPARPAKAPKATNEAIAEPKPAPQPASAMGDAVPGPKSAAAGGGQSAARAAKAASHALAKAAAAAAGSACPGGGSGAGADAAVQLPSGVIADANSPLLPHLSTNIVKLFEIEFANKPRLLRVAKFVLAQPSRAVFARCSAQDASPDAPVYMLTAVMLRSPPGTPALWVSPAPGTGNPDVDRQVDSISRISQMRSAESQPRVTGSINWRTCIKFATVPLGATSYTPDLQLTWLLERNIGDLDSQQLDERYRAMASGNTLSFPASAVLPPAATAPGGASAPAAERPTAAPRAPAAKPPPLATAAPTSKSAPASPTSQAPPKKAADPPSRAHRAQRAPQATPAPVAAEMTSDVEKQPLSSVQQRAGAAKRGADVGSPTQAAAPAAQAAAKRVRRSSQAGARAAAGAAAKVPAPGTARPTGSDGLDVLAAAACDMERQEEEKERRSAGSSGKASKPSTSVNAEQAPQAAQKQDQCVGTSTDAGAAAVRAPTAPPSSLLAPPVQAQQLGAAVDGGAGPMPDLCAMLGAACEAAHAWKAQLAAAAGTVPALQAQLQQAQQQLERMEQELRAQDAKAEAEKRRALAAEQVIAVAEARAARAEEQVRVMFREKQIAEEWMLQAKEWIKNCGLPAKAFRSEL